MQLKRKKVFCIIYWAANVFLFLRSGQYSKVFEAPWMKTVSVLSFKVLILVFSILDLFSRWIRGRFLWRLWRLKIIAWFWRKDNPVLLPLTILENFTCSLFLKRQRIAILICLFFIFWHISNGDFEFASLWILALRSLFLPSFFPSATFLWNSWHFSLSLAPSFTSKLNKKLNSSFAINNILTARGSYKRTSQYRHFVKWSHIQVVSR